MLTFIIGLLLGGNFGFLIAALCVAAGRADHADRE